MTDWPRVERMPNGEVGVFASEPTGNRYYSPKEAESLLCGLLATLHPDSILVPREDVLKAISDVADLLGARVTVSEESEV